MNKEKTSVIKLDSLSVLALLIQLCKKSCNINFSYYTRFINQPNIHIDRCKINKDIDIIDSDSSFNLDSYLGWVKLPKEFLDYETEYYYEYKLDDAKLSKLSKDRQNSIVFGSLVSKIIPDDYKMRNERIIIKFNGSNFVLSLEIDCAWEMFDDITNGLDVFRKQLINEANDFKAMELESSKEQPEGFWESIDNMMENL